MSPAIWGSLVNSHAGTWSFDVGWEESEADNAATFFLGFTMPESKTIANGRAAFDWGQGLVWSV